MACGVGSGTERLDSILPDQVHPTAGEELSVKACFADGRAAAEIQLAAHGKRGTLRVYRLEAIILWQLSPAMQSSSEGSTERGNDDSDIIVKKVARAPGTTIIPATAVPQSATPIIKLMPQSPVGVTSPLRHSGCVRMYTLVLRPPSALPMSFAHTQSPSALVGHDAETAAGCYLAGSQMWSRPRTCQWQANLVNGRRGAGLGLVPFGFNAIACRPGALRTSADQSGAGSSVVCPKSSLRAR